MYSSHVSEQEHEVSLFKRNDSMLFKSLVISQITEIVDVPYLEEMVSDASHRAEPVEHKIIKAIGWYKEKRRKETLKRKSNKEKRNASGVIGAELNQDHVEKINVVIDYLNQPSCLQEEGLFRKSGNLSRQKRLEVAFNNCEEADTFKNQLYEEQISPHDVAGLLKLFLREMPEPLLTNGPKQVYKRLTDLQDTPKKMLECLQLCFQLLPKENEIILWNLLQLLHKTTEELANKMTADTLGTLFAPHILSCRPNDAESLKLQAESGDTALIMAFMIRNSKTLFQVPLSLVHSIRREEDLRKQKTTVCAVRSKEYEKQSSRLLPEENALHPVKRFTYSQDEISEEQDFQAVEMAKLYANIASMKNTAKKKKVPTATLR